MVNDLAFILSSTDIICTANCAITLTTLSLQFSSLSVLCIESRRFASNPQAAIYVVPKINKKIIGELKLLNSTYVDVNLFVVIIREILTGDLYLLYATHEARLEEQLVEFANNLVQIIKNITLDDRQLRQRREHHGDVVVSLVIRLVLLGTIHVQVKLR